MQKKQSQSWGVVILWCILFFPAGLFLLYRRINSHKNEMIKNGKNTLIIAIIFIVIGLIGFMSISNSDSDTTSIDFTFVLLGIALIPYSRRLTRKGIKFQAYYDIIMEGNLRSIDEIAQTAGVTFQKAKDEIQNMIVNEYFPGGFISNQLREIVIPSMDEYLNKNVKSRQMVSYVCKNCGGKGLIEVGKTSVCEYCGTPL